MGNTGQCSVLSTQHSACILMDTISEGVCELTDMIPRRTNLDMWSEVKGIRSKV